MKEERGNKKRETGNRRQGQGQGRAGERKEKIRRVLSWVLREPADLGHCPV